jgi:hypothetical protein
MKLKLILPSQIAMVIPRTLKVGAFLLLELA